MNLTVSKEEFKLLKDFIEASCGIAIDDSKTYLIESRLSKLVVENSCNTFGDFYNLIKSSTDAKLKEKIIDAITTNETLWFRDNSPYQTLEEKLLPELLQQCSKENRELRIWSAACSTGQEPYSIAMILDNLARQKGHSAFLKSGKVKILATDISSTALFLAKLGRYDQLAMSRGMREEFKTRYFTEQGNVSILSNDIKSMVTFQKFNVQDSFHTLGKFDIIFLRNIAIYFSDEFKRELFYKIAETLNPGGYLFIGSSEFFMNYQLNFELCTHERCSYYKRKPTLSKGEQT